MAQPSARLTATTQVTTTPVVVVGLLLIGGTSGTTEYDLRDGTSDTSPLVGGAKIAVNTTVYVPFPDVSVSNLRVVAVGSPAGASATVYYR
jgi:hypothetical protein